MNDETTEIHEQPAPEEPPRALAVRPPARPLADQAGTHFLAELSDEEFAARLGVLTREQARIREVQRALLVEGEDYGVIPGTRKPTLLKPGAEKLCKICRLVPTFRTTERVGDGQTSPTIAVSAICELHLGTADGPVVAEGVGAANSWEKRYRYRRGERVCPECARPGTVIKGKAEYGGGWLCFGKRGGCGAKWPDGDPTIEDQVVGDVENPDPWELQNTLWKMAKKRAHVDATLSATATSGLFTQDLEDQVLGPSETRRETAAKAARATVDQAAPLTDAEQEMLANARLQWSTFTTEEEYDAWAQSLDASQESEHFRKALQAAWWRARVGAGKSKARTAWRQS